MVTALFLTGTSPGVSKAHAGVVRSCGAGGSLRIGGAMRSTIGTGGIPGVSVRLVGTGPCVSETTSGSRGGYLFSGLQPGAYRITPSRAGCGFDPAHRTVTISDRGALANFDVTCV